MRTLSLVLAALCACLALAGCGRVHLGTHDGGGGGEDAGRDAGTWEPCGSTLCAPGTECCNASCGVCAAPGEGCATIVCVQSCTSDADCLGGYCAVSPGLCGGAGTCVPRPTECPPVIRESCGCDGVTYSSPCDASASGVNVLFDGPCEVPMPCDAQDIEPTGACALVLGVRWNGAECESFSGCSCVGADCDDRFPSLSACEARYAGCQPGGCTSNADCADGRYCHFESGCGVAGTAGECRSIPGELPCPPGGQPVCGCDGADYGCAEAAHQSGVSVAHGGACDACGPMDAAGAGACFLFLGFKWNGAACESLGGCECVGADCEELVDTLEECEAAHASCVPPPSP